MPMYSEWGGWETMIFLPFDMDLYKDDQRIITRSGYSRDAIVRDTWWRNPSWDGKKWLQDHQLVDP